MKYLHNLNSFQALVAGPLENFSDFDSITNGGFDPLSLRFASLHHTTIPRRCYKSRRGKLDCQRFFSLSPNDWRNPKFCQPKIICTPREIILKGRVQQFNFGLLKVFFFNPIYLSSSGEHISLWYILQTLFWAS